MVGEPLRNVNIYAGQEDPIALSDEHYPAWLRAEIDRPCRADPRLFLEEGTLPTRKQLRTLNKTAIREKNEEKGSL